MKNTQGICGRLCPFFSRQKASHHRSRRIEIAQSQGRSALAEASRAFGYTPNALACSGLSPGPPIQTKGKEHYICQIKTKNLHSE